MAHNILEIEQHKQALRECGQKGALSRQEAWPQPGGSGGPQI